LSYKQFVIVAEPGRYRATRVTLRRTTCETRRCLRGCWRSFHCVEWSAASPSQRRNNLADTPERTLASARRRAMSQRQRTHRSL